MASAVRLASCSVTGCSRAMKRWFPEETERAEIMARIEAIVKATPPVSDELAERVQHHDDFAEIINTPDIDAGEALLVVATQLLEDPSLLLTGDKRFILALKKGHPELFARVRSQLVSFEGCVLRACRTDGTASVIERLRRAAACDSIIGIALGSGATVTEQAFLEAFTSFDPLRLDLDAT